MSIACPIIMLDGRIADLGAFRAEDIDFAQVAVTLSKIARFNGRHAGPALSVAQHCVMGADALFRETGDQILAGYFLLHDAHEWALGDINRPVAVRLDHLIQALLAEAGYGPDIARGLGRKAIERAKAELDLVIHEAAKLPPISRMPAYERQVAEMDDRMCHAEARVLYALAGEIPLVRCDLSPPKLVGGLRAWGAMKAEEAYIDRLERYLGIVVARIA